MARSSSTYLIGASGKDFGKGHTVQLVLDVAGFVPGAGEPFDLLSELITLYRGDYVGFTLSLDSMIPIAGWAGSTAKLARSGKRVPSHVDEAASVGAALGKIPLAGASSHLNSHGHAIRNINPKGFIDNCGSCVIAIDATLAGNCASTINTGKMYPERLAKHFKSEWETKNVAQASRAFLTSGPRSRAIMYATFKNDLG